MKQGYRRIGTQKQFVKMLLANFINRLGDSVDAIAFSWLVYMLTDSASWSAVVLGVNALPNVFLQPFAGAMVETMNKKLVMIVCDLIRGILTAVVAVSFMLGVCQPWLLLVVTFCNSTLESFRNPASSAITPLILERDCYEFGLSLSQSSARICELIGTALGGILIASVGLASAIWVDVVSFFLSAACIGWMRVVQHEEKGETKASTSYLQNLKEGIVYVRNIPILLLLFCLLASVNAILVPFNSFLAPYISGILHQNADLLSITSLALSFGMGAGSFLYPYLHRIWTNRHLLLSGILATAGYYAALAWIPAISSAFLLYGAMIISSFLFGLGIALLIAISSISFMKHTEESYLARTSALSSAVGMAAMPLTSFLLSILCEFISIPTIYLAFAVFTFLGFAVMIFVQRTKEL